MTAMIILDDNPTRLSRALLRHLRKLESRFSVQRGGRKKGRGCVSNTIPYRNAHALLVLQRVVLAPRAAVPVLHDGCFRANVTQPVVDRSLTGINGAAVSSRRHAPNMYF